MLEIIFPQKFHKLIWVTGTRGPAYIRRHSQLFSGLPCFSPGSSPWLLLLSGTCQALPQLELCTGSSGQERSPGWPPGADFSSSLPCCSHTILSPRPSLWKPAGMPPNWTLEAGGNDCVRTYRLQGEKGGWEQPRERQGSQKTHHKAAPQILSPRAGTAEGHVPRAGSAARWSPAP